MLSFLLTPLSRARTWLASLGLFLLCASHVLAGPASGDVAEEDQPGSSARVRLRLHGDEWFAYNATDDGYVIKKDADGKWKYAVPRQDSVAFDILPDAVVGEVDPASRGLKKHDLPPAALLRQHRDNLKYGGREKQVNEHGQGPGSPQSPSQPGPSSGGTSASPSAGDATEAAPAESTGDTPPPSEAPATPATGSLKAIVILAAFSDHWTSGTVTTGKGKTRAEYDALFRANRHFRLYRL